MDFLQCNGMRNGTPNLNLDFAQLSGLTVVLFEGPHSQDSSFVKSFRLDFNRVP